MKRKIVVTLIILIFSAVINFLCNGNVKFELLNIYSNKKFNIKNDIVLINSANSNVYNEIDLNQYNVDFGSSTIIISRKKIKKINLMRKYRFVPVYTNFITINFFDDSIGDKIYVYVVRKKHVYFDEKYDINDFYY